MKAIIATVVAIVAFFGATQAHAQVAVNTQHDTIVGSSDTNFTFYIGTTTQATPFTIVSLWLNDSVGLSDSTTVRLTCFANSYSTSQAGCTITAAINSTASYNVTNTGGGQRYDFSFPSGTQLQGGKVYIAEVITSSGVALYGASTLAFNKQCTYFGTGATDCTGAPYLAFNASIQWDLIQFPLVYSSSSAAIATSSPLWGSLSIASTTAQCNSDNLFTSALCTAGTYLFIPNPQILNNYTELASSTIPSRFPFSWVFDIKDVITGASATSSMGTTTYAMNLTALGIGSTTPMGNILPNFTFFSEATVRYYLPDSLWNAFQALFAATLWLLLAHNIYFTILGRHSRV